MLFLVLTERVVSSCNLKIVQTGQIPEIIRIFSSKWEQENRETVLINERTCLLCSKTYTVDLGYDTLSDCEAQ